MIRAYEIDVQTVGRVIIYLHDSDIPIDAAGLVHLLSQSDIEVNVTRGDSTAPLLDSVAHVESNTWDARSVITVAVTGTSLVTMLIGPNAPIVMERKSNTVSLLSYVWLISHSSFSCTRCIHRSPQPKGVPLILLCRASEVV